MNRSEAQKEHREKVETSLLEIKEEQLKTRIDIAQIKIDLAHHIKRSDKHERWLMVMIVGASVTAGIGIKHLLPFVMKLIF
jgi:hypothetical protein